MHLFLTGEIGIGKSTVIDRLLTRGGLCAGGFRTYFGPDRNSPRRFLYMSGAGDERVFSEEYAVAAFSENASPRPFTERFDTFGSELLRRARREASLILMDECGRLERDALVFQKEILETLDGRVPVIGVVAKSGGPWTERICSHPLVKVVTVTRTNREQLPSRILQELIMSTGGAR